MKILFVAPFILDTKSDAPAFPMHYTTKAFIDALVFEDYEVTSVTTYSEFEVNVANCDLVIVMADGNWLIDAINSICPAVPIIYYFIITKPKSSFVKAFPLPDLSSKMLIQIKEFMK